MTTQEALDNPWAITSVSSAEQVGEIRALFREYAGSIPIDLCFQHFEEELAELPGKYAPPAGRLLLASRSKEPAGCVGLRPIAVNTCEMKRLYVRPAFRGQGLGRALALAVIQAARQESYQRMQLDTLASMTAAISLYESLGFRRIDPYYENPSECAVFMALNLRGFA